MSEFKPEYEQALYDVDLGFRMLVGEPCSELGALLAEHGTKDWAFITPYDPFGAKFPAELNHLRFERMKATLAAYPCFPGRGHDGIEGGCCEESLLVLGISEVEAMQVGRDFDQEAILVGPGLVPRLKNCWS